jgi:hypothetical protein
MTHYEGDTDNAVKLVSLRRKATFTVEMSERAVQALRMINAFGIESLKSAVSKLSPREAEEHGDGLRDLVALGGVCAAALERLSDARDVIEGTKVARPIERVGR